MFAASRRSMTRHRNSPQLSEAVIHEALGDELWRLDDGRSARQATSCLITPQPGDRVLLVCMADESHYVLHVLARKDGCGATLSVPGADSLSIRQRHVDVAATQTIALRAACDVEITAVQGRLSLSARDIFTSAAESLVHIARSFVGQVDRYLLDARQLLRLHGEHTIVTARQDAKIDAERVSLG
ncbi:DUF3540 domain-containing protein [Dyella subtropica]|uniref:DUF3540 domain-containing protein n=1 Tax=Dyella subtropica TaxID=2992127 RepID=UPI00224CBB4F|nr:DUF3540 domain-containing protein [Dyella subtropica]